MQDKRDEDLLKKQIQEIMNEDQRGYQNEDPRGYQRESQREFQREYESESEYESENEYEREDAPKPQLRRRRKKKKNKTLKVVGLSVITLLFILALILGTKVGRKLFVYPPASNFIYQNMDNDDIIKEYEEDGNHEYSDVRQEEYITNYLIFGIEEIGGARNTDSMMIASINTKDDTLKLTSLLRDSYVEIPGYKSNKLNSAYSKGGARLLVDTVQLNYKIKIDGYVSVDFKSFEKIVDLLGGVTIELGKEEAKYLNKTNYISKKANRNVKAGVNKLNGNQLMGYCRVRKVKTLGGANNDYGRIVRQQRALKAIFDSYKAPRNLVKILPNTKRILSYVTTNLTQSQIEKAMEDVVENKMTSLDTFRIPVDGAFEAPRKYNGIGYPIVLDWDRNRIELYKFIYNDSEKDAKAELASLNK